MPQLLRLSKELNISTRFIGFRRCRLLCWFPYLTGSKPALCIKLTTVVGYSPRDLQIEHLLPNGTTRLERTCSTPILDTEHKVRLWQLTESGHHAYSLFCRLKDAKEMTWNYSETLMLTGNVPYWDSVVRGCLLFLGAAFLASIGWIVNLVIN
jgi:hypothetical protein